jgi:hypothetical protein
MFEFESYNRKIDRRERGMTQSRYRVMRSAFVCVACNNGVAGGGAGGWSLAVNMWRAGGATRDSIVGDIGAIFLRPDKDEQVTFITTLTG